jgi:hypothetical protein
MARVLVPRERLETLPSVCVITGSRIGVSPVTVELLPVKSSLMLFLVNAVSLFMGVGFYATPLILQLPMSPEGQRRHVEGRRAWMFATVGLLALYAIVLILIIKLAMPSMSEWQAVAPEGRAKMWKVLSFIAVFIVPVLATIGGAFALRPVFLSLLQPQWIWLRSVSSSHIELELPNPAAVQALTNALRGGRR